MEIARSKPAEPPWFTIARAEVGIRERQGEQDHPRIVEYLSCVKLGAQLHHDETPWCAAFVNWVLKQAGVAGTGKANARSFLSWGDLLTDPRPGCIVVLWRGMPGSAQGHVGFFVRNGGGQVWLLGGNQNNAVGITPYPVDRVVGYRWPSPGDFRA